MAPKARRKFGAPMFEPYRRSFWSKCTVLKKVFVTLLGLFGASRSDSAPGEMLPLAPLVTPLQGSIMPLRQLQHGHQAIIKCKISCLSNSAFKYYQHQFMAQYTHQKVNLLSEACSGTYSLRARASSSCSSAFEHMLLQPIQNYMVTELYIIQNLTLLRKKTFLLISV